MVLRIEGDKINGSTLNAKLNNGDDITGFLSYISHDENGNPCVLEVDLSEYFRNRPVKREGKHSITLTNIYSDTFGNEVATRDVFEFLDGKLMAFIPDENSTVFGARVVEDQLMRTRNYSESGADKQTGADNNHGKAVKKHQEREKGIIKLLTFGDFDVKGTISEKLKEAVNNAHENNGLKHINLAGEVSGAQKGRKRAASPDSSTFVVRDWAEVEAADRERREAEDRERKEAELKRPAKKQNSNDRRYSDSDAIKMRDDQLDRDRRILSEPQRANLQKGNLSGPEEDPKKKKQRRVSESDLHGTDRNRTEETYRQFMAAQQQPSVVNNNTYNTSTTINYFGTSIEGFHCDVYDNNKKIGDKLPPTHVTNGIIYFDLGQIYNGLNQDNSLHNKPIKKEIHGVDEKGKSFTDEFTYYNGKLVSFKLAENSTNLSVLDNIRQVEQNAHLLPAEHAEHRMQPTQINAERQRLSRRNTGTTYTPPYSRGSRSEQSGQGQGF